jgi:uncharacterized protein YecT (DUF1311 family)
MRLTTYLLALVAVSAQSLSFAAPGDEARKADSELNATYQRVMDQLRGDRRDSLRNAQRAWVAFRDGTCSFESALRSGAATDWVGQQTNPAQDSLCIKRLTLERLAHLRRYSDYLSAGAPVAPTPSASVPTSCRLDDLPKDFTVQAVGVHEGNIDTDVQLDASGSETKSVEVVVNTPGANVVVVLMAYSPVVWQLKRTRESNVAAVIVGGYYAQAVVGIERSVPLLIATNTGRKDCEQYFYAYKAGESLMRANTVIKNLTGREIDRLWSSYKADIVHIGPPPPRTAALMSSDDYKPEDYTSLPRFPSGQKGLNRLIELGLLRRATKQDADAWVEKASEKYKKFNQNLAVRGPSGPRGTYVVLGKMTFPAGLYGGDSVAFLIPPGIPLPDGNSGHSAVYYLEDGTCRGAVCGEE